MAPESNAAADPMPVLSEFSPTSATEAAPGRRGIHRVLRVWTKLEGAVIGLLMGTALALVIYTILARYFVPDFAPIWTDEISVYLVVWGTFIACSSLTGENRHVRADLITSCLSGRWRALCEIASEVCGAAFAGLLAYYGYLVAYEAWDFGDLSTTILRFPMWIYYACLPVGAALITLRHLVGLCLMAVAVPEEGC